MFLLSVSLRPKLIITYVQLIVANDGPSRRSSDYREKKD